MIVRRKGKVLFHNKPDLSLYDCAKNGRVEIKARDGLDSSQVILTRPLNATEPTPLIVCSWWTLVKEILGVRCNGAVVCKPWVCGIAGELSWVYRVLEKIT